jgi:hypothetical protein
MNNKFLQSYWNRVFLFFPVTSFKHTGSFKPSTIIVVFETDYAQRLALKWVSLMLTLFPWMLFQLQVFTTDN